MYSYVCMYIYIVMHNMLYHAVSRYKILLCSRVFGPPAVVVDQNHSRFRLKEQRHHICMATEGRIVQWGGALVHTELPVQREFEEKKVAVLL